MKKNSIIICFEKNNDFWLGFSGSQETEPEFVKGREYFTLSLNNEQEIQNIKERIFRILLSNEITKEEAEEAYERFIRILYFNALVEGVIE